MSLTTLQETIDKMQPQPAVTVPEKGTVAYLEYLVSKGQEKIDTLRSVYFDKELIITLLTSLFEGEVELVPFAPQNHIKWSMMNVGISADCVSANLYVNDDSSVVAYDCRCGRRTR